jgi:hypothetical protein
MFKDRREQNVCQTINITGACAAMPEAFVIIELVLAYSGLQAILF